MKYSIVWQYLLWWQAFPYSFVDPKATSKTNTRMPVWLPVTLPELKKSKNRNQRPNTIDNI
jgi:hypothetical protein